MNSNYNYYLKTDLSSYTGKWIAIEKSKIVAVGKNAKAVYDEAVGKGCKRPLITRVPDKETMIL